MARAVDCGDYFRIKPNLRDLNYEKFVESGEVKISESTEYSSHNTTRLNVEQVAQLLLQLDVIQDALGHGTPNARG